MRILVTGANGLIGRIISSDLKKDFELFKLDRNWGIDQDENSLVCDISDYPSLEEKIKKILPIDCIIHLAADPDPEASWESVLKNNIIGTKNIYSCAQALSVPKVIFASSNRVTHGYESDSLSQLITTSDQVRPDSDYAVSKLFGEVLAREYFELFSIQSICLRIGSVLCDDNPTKEERHRKTWLSHNDLIQLVRKSIEAPVQFGIYYGVSNNKDRIWDIYNAHKDLNFLPVDDASKA